MTHYPQVRFHKIDDVEQLARYLIELHFHIGGSYNVTDDDNYFYVTLG
jgi:hypothetical protein